MKGVGEDKGQVQRLFLHSKPFLILKMIYFNDNHVYAAIISRKIDCSYSYIVKLLNKMSKLDIVKVSNDRHKKIIKLTDKGKKLFKLLMAASAIK
ncbi:MAG: hypothetical protein OH316_00270 [Candidatus Parvarchaeota archaeon]|nr:hypothetical protein [Candidatus Parvarchaeota archaeon]MCW1301562.1 hypothetical protein [Candidatus Parvarchaeota archaeon]